MMGSLRNPAGWCNVYGFRPSWGRVPADPVEDTYLHRLGTDGPMGRSVRGHPRAAAHPVRRRSPLAAVRAWPPLDGPLDTDVARPPRRLGGRLGRRLADGGRASKPLRSRAFRLRRPRRRRRAAPPPHPADALWESWTTLRSFSVASASVPLWCERGRPPALNAQAVWEVERGRALSALDLQRASALRSAWLRRAVELFERCDALILPTAQVFPFDLRLPWPTEIAGRAMDTYHRWMEVMIPASLLGLPALAVPCGFDARGLPMGLQIIGAPGRDMEVLQLGQAWHRATDWPARRPPPTSPDLPASIVHKYPRGARGADGPSASAFSAALARIPERVHLREIRVLGPPPLRRQRSLDRPEPPRELGVGGAERGFGVDLQVPGEVGHDEEEIAEFLELPRRVAFGLDQFARLLDDLVEDLVGRGPVEADAGGAVLQFHRAGQGGQAQRHAVERAGRGPRSAAFCASQSRVCCSAVLSRLSSPKTCGWRAIILSEIAATTSSKVKCPASAAIWAW